VLVTWQLYSRCSCIPHGYPDPRVSQHPSPTSWLQSRPSHPDLTGRKGVAGSWLVGLVPAPIVLVVENLRNEEEQLI
jgi:hypothetical protein